jgi:PAP2 superfamily
MAMTRYRLGYLLGLAALALVLPACSAPVRTTAVDIGPGVVPLGESAKPQAATPPASAGSAENLAAWATPEGQDSLLDPPSLFWDRLDRDLDLSLQDYRNYYSLPNLLLLGLGVGAMEPVANTPADNHIRNWMQKRGHGHAESLAELFGYGGQLWVALPVGLEIAALCGKAPEDYATDGGWFEWSNRSLRAIAVGFPPVLAGYALLGSGRPDLRYDSHWHPFDHFHGVSGHTFIGAVPFLTAASMTDNPWIKYPLVFGSFMTGWSRLYQDRHYFSQVALGWWCAVLAVRSVNLTENQRLSVVPMVTPSGAGMGLEWHF